MKLYKVVVKGMDSLNLFKGTYKTLEEAKQIRYKLFEQGYCSILSVSIQIEDNYLKLFNDERVL